MITLCIRTDKPQAEIALYKDESLLAEYSWQADRQLAETLHSEIRRLVQSQSLMIDDIQAIVVFAGPGSFTGLRIGISVANSLAYALRIPIVGAQTDEWKVQGVTRLKSHDNDEQIVPFYGAEPNITVQKK